MFIPNSHTWGLQQPGVYTGRYTQSLKFIPEWARREPQRVLKESPVARYIHRQLYPVPSTSHLSGQGGSLKGCSWRPQQPGIYTGRCIGSLNFMVECTGTGSQRLCITHTPISYHPNNPESKETPLGAYKAILQSVCIPSKQGRFVNTFQLLCTHLCKPHP